VFWSEPELDNPESESKEESNYTKSLRIMEEINQRYINELNGEGTSRIPLIESQDKPRIGKRFRKNY
jgi:hypothetical protein